MDRVQSYAELTSQDEVEQTTKAVLATLGERIYRTELADLQAQLPKEMQEFLYAEQPAEGTRRDIDRYALDEFYRRAGARMDVLRPEAVKRVKAVMAVLGEAVSAGEIQDVRDQLPDEYAEIFGGPPGTTHRF